MFNFDINTHYVSWLLIIEIRKTIIEISFNYALFLEEGWGKMISIFLVSKDTTYKIRNHAFLILVYNHPTSLCQDQSMAIATANFA